MIPATIEQLNALNRAFYATVSAPFVRSRSAPQPGFERMLACLPQPCDTVLDVGCGDGRYGRFLRPHVPTMAYTGVDFAPDLLTHAADAALSAETPDTFLQRDLTQPDALAGLGSFDWVVCLAALHHIPATENRQRLLRDLASVTHGRLCVSTWQFLDSERQRRKLRDWSLVGLSDADVEPGDCLLSWQRGVEALRYVRHIDEDEMAALADSAELEIVDQFRSDGRSGTLSLYTILQPRHST